MKKLVLTFIFVLTLTVNGWCASRYFCGAYDDDWNDAQNWDDTSSGGAGGAGVPTSADDAILDAESPSCSVDVAAVCLSLDCTGYTATLTLENTFNLTVSGSITLVAGMTFTPGTQTVTVNATSTITTGGKEFYALSLGKPSDNTTITLGDNVTVNNTLTFNINGGNVVINGNTIYAKGDITKSNASGAVTGTTALNINGTGAQTISVDALSVAYPFSLPITINKGGGTLTLSGTNYLNASWTHQNGTVDPGTSTMSFGTANLTITSNTMEFYNFTFYSLNVNTTFTLVDDLTVNNTLYINGGNANPVINGAYNINAKGDISTNSSGGNYTGSATLNITGGNTQSVTLPTLASYGFALNIIINKSGNTLTWTGTSNYKTGTITYTAGTVDCSTGTSTLQIVGSCTLNTNGMSWYNFTLPNVTQTITLTSDLTITNTFTPGTNGSCITTFSGAYNIHAQGNISPGGAATSIKSTDTTLLIDGSATHEWACNGMYFMMPVTINKSGGTLTISGTLYLYAASGVTTMTWTYTAGTVSCTGAVDCALNGGTFTFDASGMNFNNFGLGSTSASFTVTLSSDLNVTGTFKPCKGAYTATFNGNTINASGDITFGSAGQLKGTSVLNIMGNAAQTLTGGGGYLGSNLTINKGGDTLSCSGILYVYGGAGTESITYTAGIVDCSTGSFDLKPSQNIILNTNGMNWYDIEIRVGTTTLSSALSVDGTLTIGNGAGDTLNAAGHNITCSGNWTKNASATFTPGTGTVIFDGTSTVAGATAFYSLTLANASTVHLTSSQIFSTNASGTFTATSCTLDATTPATRATLTVNGGQAVSSVTATDIDSSAGNEVLNNYGTVSNCLNWTVPAQNNIIYNSTLYNGVIQ